MPTPYYIQPARCLRLSERFILAVIALIAAVVQRRIDCNIDGHAVNNSGLYDDDMVIHAPAWFAMQEMINVL